MTSAQILEDAARSRRLPDADRIRAVLGGRWIDAELVTLRAMEPGPERTVLVRWAAKRVYALDREFAPAGVAGRKWLEQIERELNGLVKETEEQ